MENGDLSREGSWTAVSRTPFMKAIAMHPKGDCFDGGGLWTDRNAYWLNGGGDDLLTNEEVRRDMNFQNSHLYGSECLSVYYPRLIRDGWKLIERESLNGEHQRDIFEKVLAPNWTLCKIAHAQSNAPQGKGCYWDEHQLRNTKSGINFDFPDWEWAD